MKKLLTFLFIPFCIYESTAQHINYGRDAVRANAVSVSFNWDFAASAGLSYQKNTDKKCLKSFGADLQMPFGKDLFDEHSFELFQDWQIAGATNSWKLLTRTSLQHKRMQNKNARLSNTGVSVKPFGGYYGRHFHIGLEAGYERSLFTKFYNYENLNSDFPEIKNGISFKAQSQVFSAGIRSIISIKRLDISTNAGMVNIGHLGGAPFVPFFFSLGLSYGF